MKQITINIPIFDQQVVVIGSEKLETIFQYLAETEGFVNQRLAADASTVNYEDGRIFICLTHNIEDSIIIHESVHAVYALIELLGLKLEDEEIFAYLLEFIYKEIKKHV